MQAAVITFFLGLLTLISIASCTTLVPRPNAAHLHWAESHWPGMQAEDLNRGRKLFITRCAGCHTLPAPDGFGPEEWPKRVKEMVDKAELSEKEGEDIERYLSSASAVARDSRELRD